MVLLDKDASSYTWHIENFSMCPQLTNECIESPTFVVYGMKWQLRMFPKGIESDNYVSCFIRRFETSLKVDSIIVDYEFTAYSMNAKNYFCKRKNKRIFGNYRKSVAIMSCPREHILNTQNGFLPNDTLSMECRLWVRIDGEDIVTKSPASVSEDSYLAFSDASLRKEMLTTAVRTELLGFETLFTSSHFLARTRVHVSRKCIIWPIGKVCALRPDQRLTIPVVTADVSAPSFAITLYLSGKSADDQSVRIEIRIEESNFTKVCFVKCRLTAVNCSMENQHTAEDKHSFEPTKKNNVWKFPTFLQMSSLMEEKYLDATQGTLNLRCEFAFSREGDWCHIEDTDAFSLLNQFPKYGKEEINYVQSMCKQMYEEGKFSDVTLQTDGQSFKAHKSILSVRSSVFRAMFETDMRENESGIVDIIDYDSDTVEQLLAFIYTNSLNLEDLQLGKTMKLYSVADKYEVLSLKCHCSNHLMSTLSISNVCNVLNFADLHQDGDLLHHVKCYIQLNSNVILRSQVWKDFMKSNSSLTSQVMLDLLTGEINHL